MLIGAAMFILYPMIGMYIYGIGTLMFALMQVKAEYLGRNITIMRLRRQLLLFCPGTGPDEYAGTQMGTLSPPGMGHRPDHRLCARTLHEFQDSK